jgi:hypothetical protein
MSNIDLLERAFELAADGRSISIYDLYKILRKEGYSDVELVQLQGRVLSRQLRQKMVEARAAANNEIDQWRRMQPDLPPRPEAMRRLVDIALKVELKKPR